MQKDARIKDAGRKTREDFFTIIFTSHFIARVRKGCWRFACERMLETEHKLHILTPLLWPSPCVFLVLLMLGSTPSGIFRYVSVVLATTHTHTHNFIYMQTYACWGISEGSDLWTLTVDISFILHWISVKAEESDWVNTSGLQNEPSEVYRS